MRNLTAGGTHQGGTSGDVPASTPAAQLLAIAALGAACSLLFTGFVFGVDNNAFHLPIVAALFDEPQFQTDTFIQSLRYFASGVWLALRGSAKLVDPYWLFLVLAYLSRLVAFLGFLLCASLLGVRGIRRAAVFAVIICFTSLLVGEAAAGDGGLFLNYFTHSEVANGTILIALYFAVRARFDLALTFIGVTFFINIFMAVWLFLPFTALAVTYLRTGKLQARQLVTQTVIGAIPFAVCAAPVLINYFSNPDFGRPLSFDYTAFTIFHYPYHFLPNFTPLREYVELLMVAVLGWLSLTELGAAAAPLRILMAGMVVTYMIGVVGPFVSTSPMLLNLSFLRSGVLLYLVAALAAAAVAANWLFGTERFAARLFAPVLIVALCSNKQFLPVAILCIVLAWIWRARAWSLPIPRLDWLAFAVLILAVWPRAFADNRKENSHDAKYAAQLGEIGDWARQHTAANAVFLMPTEWQRKHSGRHAEPYVVVERDIVNAEGAFVYHAHRRLRGSFKEGAAMLWTPSFYREWRPDIDATLRLRNIDEKSAYAERNHIDYILASCMEPGASNYTPVERTTDVCVFAPR
jgi:hypothetical protein